MQTAEFDYQLPHELIATKPTDERSQSRLMVVDRASGAITHHRFAELPDLLHANDCLVANNTKVQPVRLQGTKKNGGARIEMLLLEDLSPQRGTPHTWKVVGQRAIRLSPGVVVEFADEAQQLRLTATIVEALGAGQFIAQFQPRNDWYQDLLACGKIPLPPYILRARRQYGLPEYQQALDTTRYQTVYARSLGSAAAPTAGFHFDESLINALCQRGLAWETITLHVGLDTFLPVIADNLEEHNIHTEWFEVSEQVVQSIRACQQQQGRVIAVGTTAVRALESAAVSGELTPCSGRTSLFITPGYEFRVVQALITNFHLPRSTLLALVSALLGMELWRAAYQHAIEEKYRFYSYGDAMLIL